MPSTRSSSKRKIPAPSLTIERARLANGLSVVIAPDKSSPTVGISINVDVGFRSEPEGRTGFAHLFEHLMFQGSVSLEKGEYDQLVEGNGGQNNGSTHPDYTDYIVMMPSNAFELSMWAEADRLRGLRLTPESLQNQIDVVKEEIRVNVLNRPYGGFPWIELPKVMFTTFNNAHDGYGSFVDLEAATLDDATDFFSKYYAPGNCQLAVAGDVSVEAALAAVERYFGDIPARDVPAVPDCSEPPPAEERRGLHHDRHAPMPAVAIGYRVPDPLQDVEDYLACAVLVEVLTDGEASRLHQRLVRNDRTCPYVGGMLGTFGDPFEMRDPTMLQILAYHPGAPVEAIVAAVDEEVGRLVDTVDDLEVERVVTGLVSQHVRRLDNVLSRAMAMATFEQQRGRAELVNELPAMLATVDAAAIAKAAERWMATQKRAILEVVPGGES